MCPNGICWCVKTPYREYNFSQNRKMRIFLIKKYQNSKNCNLRFGMNLADFTLKNMLVV